MVWMGAMLPHMKKPIPFEKFVRPSAAKKRQTRDELQLMCEALAAAWGAKFEDAT